MLLPPGKIVNVRGPDYSFMKIVKCMLICHLLPLDIIHEAKIFIPETNETHELEDITEITHLNSLLFMFNG